jgi:hypothetical protein
VFDSIDNRRRYRRVQEFLDWPGAEIRQRSIVGCCVGDDHQDVNHSLGMIQDSLVNLLPRPENIVLTQPVSTNCGRRSPMVFPIRRGKFSRRVHERIVPDMARRRKLDRGCITAVTRVIVAVREIGSYARSARQFIAESRSTDSSNAKYFESNCSNAPSAVSSISTAWRSSRSPL